MSGFGKQGDRPAVSMFMRRMTVCRPCPAFLPKSLIGDRCAECGCFLNIKARIPGAKCPRGKW